MTWRPLEQEWPEEATVRVVPGIDTWVERDGGGNIIAESPPRHAEARRQILTEASQHIAVALAALEEAVAWFSIVDPKDQGETIRRVEALRDTIEYRASL